MGFFDIEDSTAVMPFIQWMLTVFGLRGSRANFLRFQFSIFWMCLITIGPKVFLGYRDDILLVIRGLSELIFQGLATIRMVFFARKLREYEKLVDILRKWYNKTFATDPLSDFSVMITKSNKTNDLLAKKYFVTYAVIVNIYSLGPLIQSVVLYAIYNQNSTEPLELATHMEQEFYWMDIRTNIWHYTFFSACAIGNYWICAYSIVVSGVLIFSCTACCSSMFQVVSMRLETLHKYKDDTLRTELRDIVAMHVDALKCVEILEDIVNLALICQIFGCALMWCSMAVYLSYNFNANAINIMVLFLVTTADTYGLCVLGNVLSEESLAVRDAVYGYPWYEAPIDVRKSLLRMMQRSQKQVGVTAAGFFFINIERFAKLAQSSYSIYIVMKDNL